MATTEKKKTTGTSGQRTKSQGKAPSRQASKKTSKQSSAAKKQAAEQLAMRRCILGGALILVSFVGVLHLFRAGGFLIEWYWLGVSWLLGWGAELLPLVLLIVGILLIVRRRKRVRMQALTWSAVPLLYGAVHHLLEVPREYYAQLEGLTRMGKDGQALVSGGLLSGGLAELLRAALSTVGGAVLATVLLIVCVLAGCRLGPQRLLAMIQSARPLPEPEEEEPAPLPSPRREAKTVRREPASIAPRRPSVDIALDDDQTVTRTRDPNVESPLPPPTVETPGEALLGIFRRNKKAAPAPEPAAESQPQPEPVAEPASPATLEVIPELDELEPADSPTPQPETPAIDTPPWEEPEALSSESAEEDPVEVQIDRALAEGKEPPIYLYPPLRLLKPGPGKPAGSAEAICKCADRLVDTLQSFGVEASVINTTDGPAVTRYELVLQRGVKLSKVANLADDIALALGASGIRVSAIPDKNAVGIEVPNEQQELVTARDIIGSPAFQNGKSRLTFAIGKDITGAPTVGDIAKMPHMLIAGTTGSGKSVCINSILMSILYKATPEEVRLIMVDPKMIELGVYNGIPHLLIPVVTDPKKAAGALNWAVTEMMRRYTLFSEIGARNLAAYNAEVASDPDSGNQPLPQIVVVIDELADLMAVAKSDVENAIIRLAQMARAAGMHLIIATQRPSADVITGLMKDNIPSRIAFAVASAINSRIILDQSGAEKLLGKGDMLYAPLGVTKPLRIQGCFVSDQEVEEVVAFVKQCGQAEYSQEILDHIERQAQQAEADGEPSAGEDGEEDELFDEAVEIVVSSGQASVSMLQRRLRLGYSRAARLVDQMEERGIVGPFEGSKPRAVLITKSDWQERMIRKREC